LEKIWECNFLFIPGDKTDRAKDALFAKGLATMLENALKTNTGSAEDLEVIKNTTEEADKDMNGGIEK